METVTCTNCKSENTTSRRYCSSCGYELPILHSGTSIPVAANADARHGKRKRITGLIAGAIAFALSYWFVQHYVFAPPSINKVMMQAASELNKTCPVMVDQYTRLDNAVALPDNSVQYNYTLVSTTKSEVNMDTVMKYIKPSIINNVRTNPDLKLYRENNTTMVYSYKDMNGEFVYKLSVTPDMYQ